MSFGEPFSGARRYGNSFAKNAELMYAPSVYLQRARRRIRPARSRRCSSVHSTPIATRSSMSTTSSPGRRPFGKPALSPPSTPSRFCDAPRRRRDRRVEPHLLGHDDVRRLVDAVDAGQERRDEVGAREVGRRLHARAAEQHLEQRRQRRIGDVVGELPVVLRLAGVEPVLVLEADDHFVDERHAEARHLDQLPGLRRRIEAAAGVALDSCALRGTLALVQPPMIVALAFGQARDRHFEHERRDVLVGDQVGGRELGRAD